MKNLGSKRGRFTEAENAAIEAMAAKGLSPGQIAVRLDRHPGSINWAMTRMGLKAPSARSFSYIRRGKPVCSFSVEEDVFIEALACQRYNNRQIGEMCGKRFGHVRTSATIRVRLMMLANRDLVKDEAA